VVPAGTVMLAMIGEGKTRGQPAILEVPAAHNQNCASIRVDGTGVSSEWVFTFLARAMWRLAELDRGTASPP
jgi:type I restriction enzyme S subunit